MREVNATEMKGHFGLFLDGVRNEPLGITKSGRLVAILLSVEEYEHFQWLDDSYWIARAKDAEARGQWVGHEEAMQRLTDRMKQRV